MTRFWPLGAGRTVTSPFGPRSGGFHYGVDFGRAGGAANMPVYAIQAGIVIHAGAAQGYGGPDPAGWLVIDSSDSEGGGCLEYGHIVRLPHIKVGSRVKPGEQIAVINPSPATNGGTAPHLHLSDMPREYNPKSKQDPMARLASALEPRTAGTVLANNVTKEPVLGRPDFNEYWVRSPSFQMRNSAKIDLFLIHTQEGNGNADSLARYLADPANQVSYHYTISQDPNDNGVTVCDIVDTDYASYSVLSANNRSINLCFAGSSVNWSREQWLKQSRALDCAAYLAVQDCKKYKIPIKVLAPPYKSAPPGISDHKYVTEFLRDGTHSDVGPNFPWDVFTAAVNKHAGEKPPVAPPAPEVALSQAQMIAQIWEQLLGPNGKGWPQLGGKTLVNAVADLQAKLK